VQEVSCGVCGKVLSTAAKRATQCDAHLHLLVPKEAELVRNAKTNVSLGHKDHEILVFSIPRDVGKESEGAQTLEIQE